MTISKTVLWRTAAAVLAIGFLAWVLYDRFGEHEPDIATLTSDVQQSMQDELRKDPNFAPYRVTVRGVTLVEAGDNTYNGMATVAPTNGPSGRVSVKVTYDGKKLLWEVPPGSFLFLAQSQPATVG